MFYEIEALDTLFFRNAVPFQRGTDSRGESMFPPLPSVLLGALRTCYFAHHQEQFCYAGKKDKDPTESLHLGLICLKKENTLLFPLPLDMQVLEQENQGYGAQRMQLKKNQLVSSYLLDYFLVPVQKTTRKNVEFPGGFYFSQQSLNRYLHNEFELCSCVPLTDLISLESKTGIQVDRQKGVAEESMLYQVQTVRPASYREKEEKLSLLVEVQNISLPEKSLIKLGGDMKAAYLSRIKEDFSFKQSSPPHKQATWFKLYFLTPAVFANGWLPQGLDPQNFEGTIKDNEKVRVKLISAAVGRYVPVGGYDLKKNHPKEMRYAVPAGSVYYFALLEGTMDAVSYTHLCPRGFWE